MSRSGGSNYNGAGPVRYPYEGLVVVKRGKGAIVYCPSIGICLLSRSNHCVGQWLSFDTFKSGKLEERRADIQSFVDLSKVLEIESPIPTFAAFRNKYETPVMFISSYEEAEYFTCELGPGNIPRFTQFPCFVCRNPPSAHEMIGTLASWIVLKDTSCILPLKNVTYALPVLDYIHKLFQYQKYKEPEPEPIPPPPFPPQHAQPMSSDPNQQIVFEAADAVRRLMSHPEIEAQIKEYDVVAYRKLLGILQRSG